MSRQGKRPNFLVIVADDLGYSDIGCYGSEIRTPNLDRIARQGMQFTDFHTASMCSPTRSMLLSGNDNHIAGVGCMSEARRGSYDRYNVRGYEGYLNFDVVALPELLHDNGYLTLMSGKWHLGLSPETNPAARGFDKSFALLPGCSNHWGYEPQFTNNVEGHMKGIPVLYTEDGKRREVTPNMTDSYQTGFYSTEYYVSNMLKYFVDRQQNPEDKERPFFAYLPFAAPHWPLQCSKEDREIHKGLYDDGPDALRLKRLKNLQSLGLVSKDIIPHQVIGEGMKEWSEMDPEERAKTSRAMEVYAGMVHCIDRNLGRVFDYLDKTGEMDNTFVLFMSDNGAEGAMVEARPLLGRRSMHQFIETFYDNSLNNMGNHDSFFWYGPRWAQAATAPSRMYKSYTTEGGIRVPLIVRYPPLIGTETQPLVNRAFSTALDIMPTILDLANVKHPAAACLGSEMAPYRDRKVYGMKGHSWVGHLSNGDLTDEHGIYGDQEWFGWELHGSAGLRQGKWKIVFLGENRSTGKGRWELFDLEKDPGETSDLSKKMPDKLRDLEQFFDQYMETTGTVWSAHPPPRTALPSDWQLPDDAVGGNPIPQRARWHSEVNLQGEKLSGVLALPAAL